jgi:2-polyprenyl-3-methyl-5-hydroxy-6-metoxy-1,4-benzoquinol methylase
MKNKGEAIRLKKSIKLADVRLGEKVLDLGCGDMSLKQMLSPDVNYVGIDKNGGAIEYDLEDGLPKAIKNQKFDIIFMNEFIEHIENFKSILLECKQILTEKGRIIISTPSNNRILYGDFFNGIGEDEGHIHCFRKTNMRNLARLCGLKIKDIKGTYIRFLPFLHTWFLIPTNQTIYTEVIVYRLEKERLNE